MFDILFGMYHLGLVESLLDYPIRRVIPVAWRLYLVMVGGNSLHPRKSTIGVISGSCITHVSILLVMGSLSKEKSIGYIRFECYFFRGIMFVPSIRR